VSEVYSGEGGWGVVCGKASVNDGKIRRSSERESGETRFCCMVAWGIWGIWRNAGSAEIGRVGLSVGLLIIASNH